MVLFWRVFNAVFLCVPVHHLVVKLFFTESHICTDLNNVLLF